MLKDLAFFQFSYSEDDHVRYAFYPNPFISGNAQAQTKLRGWRELEDAGMLDSEEVAALISNLTTSATIPLIRYENAPSQYKPFIHPCSHFHIGLHSENRWPSSRVLTPLAFTLWIVKQYYGSFWGLGSDALHELGNPFEEKLINEKAICRILGADFFNAKEGRSTHLA